MMKHIYTTITREASSSKIRLSGIVQWLVVVFLILLFPIIVISQVNPPRPLTLEASTIESLNFGAFSITGSNGGTVTVSNTGIRNATGDIFLTGDAQSYGMFTVDIAVGTSLYLMSGSTATLTGSNGGSMTMTMGETFPPMPYTTMTSSTVFQIGATLTVKAIQDNPPGDYYGTYEIIINHQ